jgi:DNA-directed RNA polymerase specialized sigma24 family protein
MLAEQFVGFTHEEGAMHRLDIATQGAADLHWLATLLTGSRDIAADVTAQVIAPPKDSNAFSSWMNAWSRQLVIGKALAAVREDLAASARRMDSARPDKSSLPDPSWALDRQTTKSDLEQALLQIDLFARAAVLLLVFERVPLKDAAVLLNFEPDAIRRAAAAGARDLTINLARMQGGKSVAGDSSGGHRGAACLIDKILRR